MSQAPEIDTSIGASLALAAMLTGEAAKRRFWDACPRRPRPVTEDFIDAGYKLADAPRNTEPDWSAIDADEGRLWASYAVTAVAVEALAKIWAGPVRAAGLSGFTFNARELFVVLIEVVQDDTPIGDRAKALDLIGYTPFGPTERGQLADALGLPPEPPEAKARREERARRLAERLSALGGPGL